MARKLDILIAEDDAHDLRSSARPSASMVENLARLWDVASPLLAEVCFRFPSTGDQTPPR